jgi:hypothetical protein
MDILLKQAWSGKRKTAGRWINHTLLCAPRIPILVQPPSSYHRGQRWSLRREEVRPREEDDDGDSGSRVDAPQKPNCRSLVQGLEQQGLRRHLPSPFSVRVDWGDGETFVVAGVMFLVCSLVYVPKRQESLYPVRPGRERRRRKVSGSSRVRHPERSTQSCNSCHHGEWVLKI